MKANGPSGVWDVYLRISDVAAEIAEEVPGGQPEPGQHLAQVEALAQPHDGLAISSTSPVSTTLRIDSGNSPSQPSRMAWS